MTVLSAGSGHYKFDLYVNEFIAASTAMPLEQIGLYATIKVWLARVGGYLPLDPPALGKAINVDRRLVARLLPRLIERRVLVCDEDRIWDPDLLAEIARIEQRCPPRKKAEVPPPGPLPEAIPETSPTSLAEVPEKSPTSPPDLSGKIEEKQAHDLPPYKPSPSPSIKEEEEERGPDGPARGPYAFVGKVVRLTLGDYARLEAEHPAIPDFRTALNIIDASFAEKGVTKWWHPLRQKLGYMNLDYLAKKENAVAAAVATRGKPKPQPWADRTGIPNFARRGAV